MLAWREFQQTETGRRLIPKMLESVPALLPSGDSNAILIRSGEVRGWSSAAQSLLSLAAPTPEKPDESNARYPDLDDDAAWKELGHP